MAAVASLIVVLGIIGVIYSFMERAKAQRVAGAAPVKTGDVKAQSGGSAVSVEGNVVCPQPLVAPFSGTPCLYYSIKCTAEWKAGETKRTKVLSDSKSAARFAIDDGSGPAAVDAAQGGSFEPTQKRSETKGAGLMGGITGKELMFGQYAVSTGALELGTMYRVDEEVLPLQPKMYACGAVNGGAIGTPTGLRSLILSNKSRDDLLASSLKTSRLALGVGSVAITAGTILGVLSHFMTPDDAGTAAANASSSGTVSGASTAPVVTAAMPTAPADPTLETANVATGGGQKSHHAHLIGNKSGAKTR